MRYALPCGWLSASVSLVTLVTLAACGGKVGEHLAEDAGADAGAEAGADASSGPSCAELEASLARLRVNAATCCPICSTPQCTVAIRDVCCNISITASSAPDFSAAVQEYLAKCQPSCPPGPCAAAPSKICAPIDPQNPGGRGACR